ncbi:regulator of chromosome condensation 1/beta-lactamase-inhibitor protein II [Radiomyces spectabilis]|uniref:regulator of chromosome condensation 1/beta-lactamase-inhibitor protein II n=1 Tax=Radiomyces spectabilis TaxID=64574 RepID=UPI00221EDA5F|nr:regulator of chromosome condensation 1/beta-lactamase-inhibitor protein II [Radiomyces spectabilis]KAI8379195.1 regulator of chromosome condensation 1/beta-lactamase-inhibitor protein II [Radiomyces spectabilis]
MRGISRVLYGWGKTNALPLTRTAQQVFKSPVCLSEHPEYALKVIDPSKNKDDEQVTHIAGGWGHSLIATLSNVYGFGLNGSGQLGKPRNTIITDRHATSVTGVTHVACGREHSHFVTNNEQGSNLYSFGNSMYGQLGIGLDKSTRPGDLIIADEPRVVNNYKGMVRHIACGLDNTVFATDHGVYSMGWGADGQLGLGTSNDRNTPSLISLPTSKVKKLAGSTDFTLALMEDGSLWTWGNSEYGQGMQGAKIDRMLDPVRVDASHVVDIAAGGPFSVVLTDDGRVHTCGFGALGLGPERLESLVLAEVAGLSNIRRVYATTDYAAALSDSGELYTWGLNGYSGRLGLGTEDHAFVPQRIPLERQVVDVALGTTHALALCSS